MPSTDVSRIDPGIITYEWVGRDTAGNITTQGPQHTPVSMETRRRVKTWVRTPNYFALRRAGATLPENPFTYGLLERQSGTFVARAEHREVWGSLWWTVSVPKQWWARMPGTGFELTPFDLYSKLADKARRSDFSLPITVVEGRKTVQMIVSTARTLAGTIYDLRRGNLVGALGRLGITPTPSQRRRFNDRYGQNPVTAASNAWLQYSYGWKPLMNDAKNAAEALAELHLRNGEASVATVRAVSRAVKRRTWQDFTIGSSPATTGTVTATDTFSRKAIWRFKPNAADLPGLFGLTNPLEVVWEIIPFSFVADWFLPIGSYLRALDVPFRMTHVGGSEGYRRETVWVTEPKITSFILGSFQTAMSGQTATLKELSVFRTALAGPPTPSISDMRYTGNINSTRATSAIALLWQQAIRLRR